MFKIVIAIMAICLGPFSISAQDYTTSAGLRLGQPYGITFKYFLGQDDALEIIAARSSRRIFNGYHATILYEKHTNPFNVDRLRFYYGGGGHVGIYESAKFSESRPNFGVDLVAGLEYTLPNTPLNFSLDVKPAVNFFDPFHIYIAEAVSVRYILTY